MRTQIFAHKGIIGILSHPTEAEGLLNKPLDQGQLGFVVDAEHVDIQPYALELLKLIPKSNDDIGDIDVFKNKDGKVTIAWLGNGHTMLKPSLASGSKDYDPNLLTSNPNVIPEKGFISAVDEIENQ